MKITTARNAHSLTRLSLLPLLALSPLALQTARAQSGSQSGAQTGTRPLLLSKHAEASNFRGDMSFAGDFSNVVPSGESMHLIVGRSIFVNTKHRLTRVYVTNPGRH